MAVNDEANAGARRRGVGSRLGADLWPRVAAAVAHGARGARRRLDRRLRLRRVLVDRLGRRAVGMAADRARASGSSSGSPSARSRSRSPRSSPCTSRPLGALAALVVGAAAVGWLAGPAARIWAGAGALYAGALVVSLGLLRASPTYGLAAILWLFAVVWGADIAAYFAGRLIGGPKLWPSVSPGKTWSGAIVGALAGAALGLLLRGWTSRIDRLFWLGLATAVVSELGDLFESALKRRFGVKDSSRLIPGHGGLMDRLDAFIAASAFAALVRRRQHRTARSSRADCSNGEPGAAVASRLRGARPRRGRSGSRFSARPDRSAAPARR